PGPAVLERWRTAAAAMRQALAAGDPSRRVQWVAGEMAAQTLATTRLSECWIHTGDVAEALGLNLAPSLRLWHIARLAWRTLPYAFARADRSLTGPVAVSLVAPDSTMWDFHDEGVDPLTRVAGPALDFCLVAGRRREPSQTELTATGPDADAVLSLVRTYA
ncbi:MAG: maleylpyruvate isomerase family mycothiol-dependent enzyme, partial [Actinobacteria bacterium]|nr:maleylpyruvate isomerase family mycothiol-dependent enzyme [Actinomycetota bacterium]